MIGFTVDPAGLQAVVPAYDSQALALGDIYSTLRAALDAEGACWGNDDAGKAFAARYAEPAARALSQILAASEGVSSAAKGTSSWAENYLNAVTADQQDLSAQLGA